MHFYLSSAVTGLIEGDILLLFAVHAQTSLRRVPLSVHLKSHLSHVVKQLRQMLLDLSKQTGAFSSGLSVHSARGATGIFLAAVQINNVSLLLFRRAGPMFSSMPANFL